MLLGATTLSHASSLTSSPTNSSLDRHKGQLSQLMARSSDAFAAIDLCAALLAERRLNLPTSGHLGCAGGSSRNSTRQLRAHFCRHDCRDELQDCPECPDCHHCHEYQDRHERHHIKHQHQKHNQRCCDERLTSDAPLRLQPAAAKPASSPPNSYCSQLPPIETAASSTSGDCKPLDLSLKLCLELHAQQSHPKRPLSANAHSLPKQRHSLLPLKPRPANSLSRCGPPLDTVKAPAKQRRRTQALASSAGSTSKAAHNPSAANCTSKLHKLYKCGECGRVFARSDMLSRHSRLHSGLKPYQCSRCAQVFSRSDHLATHERTHTGEKPYQCHLCAYSACRRDMITRHMRTHGKRK